MAETKLPTDIGQFQLRAYRVPGAPVGQEPCVIYSRDKPPFGSASAAVPVRIHDQCLTSEVFRSQRYVVVVVVCCCCVCVRECCCLCENVVVVVVYVCRA